MSLCVQVMLLLVVMVSMSAAQRQRAGNSCFCQDLKPTISMDGKVVKYFEPSVFCNKVEIIVRRKDGLLYCLNPNLRHGQMIVDQMEQKKSGDAS